MKEIVLDTETTGISVKEGHRIVEIGCIELDNLIPTKNKFHCYLNPERKVSEPLHLEEQENFETFYRAVCLSLLGDAILFRDYHPPFKARLLGNR